MAYWFQEMRGLMLNGLAFNTAAPTMARRSRFDIHSDWIDPHRVTGWRRK